MTNGSLGRKGVISTYEGKTWQELKQRLGCRNRSRSYGGMLLTGLPSLACSVFFLIWPRATYLGNRVQWARTIHANKVTWRLEWSIIGSTPFLFCPQTIWNQGFFWTLSRVDEHRNRRMSERMARGENVVGSRVTNWTDKVSSDLNPNETAYVTSLLRCSERYETKSNLQRAEVGGVSRRPRWQVQGVAQTMWGSDPMAKVKGQDAY